jgi:uncharacterized protein YodC (DUF2158 family)
MATQFKKGDAVRVKMVVPEGPVQKMRMDEDTGDVLYLIEWTDIDGASQSRWFKEGDLQLAT